MLSNKEIVCPNNLLDVAHKKKGVKAGIVNAGKPLPMLSVQDAVSENLIEPIYNCHFDFPPKSHEPSLEPGLAFGLNIFFILSYLP